MTMPVLYGVTAAGLAICAVALGTLGRNGAAQALAVALGANALLVARHLAWGENGFEWLSHPAAAQIGVAAFLIGPAFLRLAVERAATGGPWQRGDVRRFAPALMVAAILLGVVAFTGDTAWMARTVAALVLLNVIAVPELRRAFVGTGSLNGVSRTVLRALVAVFCLHWALSMSGWAASLAHLPGAAGWLEMQSVIALLVFGIGAAVTGLRRSVQRLSPETLPSTVLERASAPDPGDAALAETLTRLLDEDDAFLDPDLTVGTLATRARATTRDTSRVLVASLGGFRHAVASRRVAHAQALLTAEPDATVLDVLHRSGFGSTSAFHRAFKTYVKATPDAYRKRMAADGRPTS